MYEAVRAFLARGPGPDNPQAPPANDEATAALARAFTTSPSLQTYAREMFHRHETALAAIIAEETGAPPEDPLPPVVAAVLLAPWRTLFGLTFASLAAGHTPAETAASHRGDLDRAYKLLATGLADFCRRPGPAPTDSDQQPRA